MALLDAADESKNAVDSVETSMGTDGLPAAIRHLTAIAQQSVDAYNRRSEVMIGGITGSAQ